MQQSLFDSKPLPEKPSAESKPVSEPVAPRVYTVSQLNAEFRFLLESTYPTVWVQGEISDFKPATSGHLYFCLKDERSQIKAVMWKSSRRGMKWQPANGMKVTVNGRVTLYEPAGTYQIDVAQMIPHGKGNLFAAFEQMKDRLQKEGLFDQKRKRPIPMLPKKIGIVTSPTGAVIRDILNILNRRYMNLQIKIFPAKVQGDEAAPSIIEGLRVLNRFTDMDVIIVARGGGSIEDLWPFNEEKVARAVVASRIPVISAVGHETDTTICDFVADLRAPTPSAAAELVIGKKSELVDCITNHSKRIHGAIRTRLLRLHKTVQLLGQHRALAGFPQKVHMYQQMLDDRDNRLVSGLRKHHQIQTSRLHHAEQKLSSGQLRHLVELKRTKLTRAMVQLKNQMSARTDQAQRIFQRLAGKLDSLSPLAVLERGYSIVCKEDGVILKQSTQAQSGDQVTVRLHEGSLKCEVKEVKHGKQ